MGTAILILVTATLLGYGTNWLAVRMLFRPRQEWRLFGRRVPLTPGVIPRQRDEIIAAIADGVASELVTTEAIKREMDKAGVLQQVEEAAISACDELSDDEAVLDDLQATTGNAIKEFILSDDFRQRMEQAIEPVVDGVIRGAFGVGATAARANPAVAVGLGLLGSRVVERMAPKLAEWLTGRLSEHLDQVAAGIVAAPRTRQALSEMIRAVPRKGFDPEGPYRERIQGRLGMLRDGVIDRLDVRTLVVERLSGYETVEIEALILRATRQHLRHIEVLGGLIGFLIGAMQLLIWRML